MLCVRASDLEKRLVILAKLTGKTKSHYVRLALRALFNKIDSFDHSKQSDPFDIVDIAVDPPLDFSWGLAPAENSSALL